jgi:hypothetical protein
MRRSSRVVRRTLLLGLVLSAVAAAPALADGVAYAPFGYSWGPTSVSDTAVFGSPGLRKGYSWRVQFGSDTQVCAQAWGFNAAHPHGAWFGAGCGSSGSASVPWGNVLANPKLRVHSITLTGGFVPWQD